MAIVGTDNEEVVSERWKMLIPKVYRLANKEAESRETYAQEICERKYQRCSPNVCEFFKY